MAGFQHFIFVLPNKIEKKEEWDTSSRKNRWKIILSWLNLFCASPTIFASPYALAMKHFLSPPMMKCWITSPKCLPDFLHLPLLFSRRKFNPYWYFLNQWYCWATVNCLRFVVFRCALMSLFFTLPAFFLKKVWSNYCCAWMRVSLGLRYWINEMDYWQVSPSFARYARKTISARKAVLLAETMAFRPDRMPTFQRFALSFHTYFWKGYGKMPLECVNLKRISGFPWAYSVAGNLTPHSLMALSRSSVLFSDQLFHVVVVSFGGDAQQTALSWTRNQSQRDVLTLRCADLLRLRVSGALPDVGLTLVTPLTISSASALLLLWRSSASALLFLHRPRYDSSCFSVNMKNPLRLWKPPLMSYFEVKAALGRTIMMTVAVLWWCEVWEKCEVVNFERVLRYAESISPPLVVVISLYSCAADSDWVLMTYDMSDVFYA